jgi:hypothetical protein
MLAGGGVDMGRRLLGADPGNVRGHFEDLDFLDLQVEALRRLGLPWNGHTEASGLRPPAELVGAAAALAEGRRLAGRPWGWKDPRSTLFLDFWQELVPELRFVLLFRAPWEVVDSLFRRGDREYRERPGDAARIWVSYNRAALDFHDRFPDRCLIVEGQAAAESPGAFAAALAKRFGDSIEVASGLYDPDMLRHDTAALDRATLAAACPEALEVYEQLRRRAALALPAAAPAPAADPDLPFRHWVACRLAEREAAEARREAAQLAEKLRAATSSRAWRLARALRNAVRAPLKLTLGARRPAA